MDANYVMSEAEAADRKAEAQRRVDNHLAWHERQRPGFTDLFNRRLADTPRRDPWALMVEVRQDYERGER